MAERARAILHASLKPHHDAPFVEQFGDATREVRDRSRREAGTAERRLNRRRVVVRSQVETTEIEVDRLARLRRGDNRRPEREAAVAHVREHVDVLHLRQQADTPRGLHVRHDAAGQREPPKAGQTNGVARERRARLLHDALREIGELLVGISPVDPRQLAV